MFDSNLYGRQPLCLEKGDRDLSSHIGALEGITASLVSTMVIAIINIINIIIIIIIIMSTMAIIIIIISFIITPESLGARASCLFAVGSHDFNSHVRALPSFQQPTLRQITYK